jgi:uncharacterized protein (TIRG00374 family)
MLLLYVQLLTSFYRWKLLLQSQKISIPLIDSVRLGMASQFFMTLGPGTLAADIARTVYISQHAPDKKIRGLSTVFLDRVMGLFGMIFLGAVSFLISIDRLRHLDHKMGPALMSMGFVLLVTAGGIVLALLLLPFLVRGFHLADENSKRKKILKIPMVGHLFEVLALYADRRDYLWYGILMSVGMHVVNVCILLLLTQHFYGGLAGLSLSEFFFAASIGIVVISLPLAPSGIGVGQVAFSTIFVALGWKSESMGGSLVTCFQILMVLMNLTGVFFLGKKKEAVA